MKTIAELARELGVTKPAVRRYLTEDVRKEFTEIIGGVIFITEQGEMLIKSKFAKNRAESDTENISENESETVSALVSMLQRELEVKNKQIEELTATIKIQAESINMSNKNELAETIIEGQASLSEPERGKKSGFFKRIFSRSKQDGN
jgi:predicted transcriptional regulator